jgi:hypothetical protein
MLNIIHDPRNSMQHAQEGGAHLFAFDSLDVAKSYGKSEACIVLILDSNLCTCKYDLVFAAIDSALGEEKRLATSDLLKFSEENRSTRSDWDNETVLGCTTKLIQCPEKDFPSLVRLEGHKERLDFIRQSFATRPNATCEVYVFGTERKAELFQVWSGNSLESSRANHSQIQSGSHILGGRNCALGEDFRERFFESEFMKFVYSIRIGFSNQRAFCALKEGGGTFFEVSDIFFSPTDSGSRACEVAHDRAYDCLMKSKPEASAEFKKFDTTVL